MREGPPVNLQFGNWTCNIDGVFSMISVDLSLFRTLPRKDLPQLVRLTTAFLRPTSRGLPDSSEWDHILRIEDAFGQAFRNRHSAVFAGHIYGGGGYEGYFYVPKYDGMPQTMDEVAASLPPDFPAYDLQMATRKDSEWTVYRQLLYPNPMGMQSILTTQVIKSLQSQGDDLLESRPVHHQALFQTKEQVSQFIGRVLQERFTVDSEQKNDKSGDGYPFSVWISRVDSVQPQQIDYTVSGVFLHTVESGGKYNGWVTKAHSPQQGPSQGS